MRGVGSTKRKMELVGMNDDSYADNEPIRSIFNLNKRKKKKKKREHGNSGKVGAGSEAKAEVGNEELKVKSVKDEDNDEDDEELTLAILKKKLKDPKGNGSARRDLSNCAGSRKTASNENIEIQLDPLSKQMGENHEGRGDDVDGVGLDQVLIESKSVLRPSVGHESQAAAGCGSEAQSLKCEGRLNQPAAEGNLSDLASIPAKRRRMSSKHRLITETPELTSGSEKSTKDLLSEFVKARRSQTSLARKHNEQSEMPGESSVETHAAFPVGHRAETQEDGEEKLKRSSRSKKAPVHKKVRPTTMSHSTEGNVISDNVVDGPPSTILEDTSATSQRKVRHSSVLKLTATTINQAPHDTSEDLLASVFKRPHSAIKEMNVVKTSVSSCDSVNQRLVGSNAKLSSGSNCVAEAESVEQCQPSYELVEHLSAVQDVDDGSSIPVDGSTDGNSPTIVPKFPILQVVNGLNSMVVLKETHCPVITMKLMEADEIDEDKMAELSKDSHEVNDPRQDDLPSNLSNRVSVENGERLRHTSIGRASNGISKNLSSVLENSSEETAVPDDATGGSLSAVPRGSSTSYYQMPQNIYRTPDSEEDCSDDAVKVSPIPDKKMPTSQRSTRKAKRPRYGDMAYEGDSDWNSLHEWVPERVTITDEILLAKTKARSDALSTLLPEANGGAAAVVAGLKAKALLPIEKIKFKEVIKRRAGLHEYLECRNMILSLWNKDVCRILPLSECGVTSAPLEDEPPRASLVRDVFSFLDSNGYINGGLASEKERATADCMPQLKLSKRSDLIEKSGDRIADTEEEVAFILGQAKHFEKKTAVKSDEEIQDGKRITATDTEASHYSQLPLSYAEVDSCIPKHIDEDAVHQVERDSDHKSVDLEIRHAGRHDMNAKENGFCRGHALVEPVMPLCLDSLSTFDKDGEVTASALTKSTCETLCNIEGQEHIIVVGAGPAGLTAARHLQRQGFRVTILEARKRMGGRVHTDHSSLSVPVDLGASIITGVEADVATGRRPDPSSLLCTQLDVELTVLNSECPLYDIVTGEKVPFELDESLEAEYNSLLDDMEDLVAQNGEAAARLSLQDGLEYGLRRRRVANPTVDSTALHHLKINGSLESSSVSGNISDGSKFAGSAESNGSKGNNQCEDALNPLERRVMNWHFAHLEYGCAASLDKVSLPNWNQDDIYGGFGGAHCMIRGGYSAVVESLAEGLNVHLNHIVSEIVYNVKDSKGGGNKRNEVKVLTENGSEFIGDAILITIPLGCLKAKSIKFTPPLPEWKEFSIQRLGFGVLNKVVLEFPTVFWDDSVDYFGATAEETDSRGHCFMFWNVKKTVGAPVLISLVAGKAAIDGQNKSAEEHVQHAVSVLHKLFGKDLVPDPVAYLVTNWGQDPFSRGTYSYVAIGASGEDYDILARPVENCLFFAGEATCKEHPDTVGGAMLSGLREAVRIIDIFRNSHDYTAEVEEMEAAQRRVDTERNEVKDIMKRLGSSELSSAPSKISLDGEQKLLTQEALLKDMFFNAKTTAGRLYVAKELLQLPVKALKSFAGTKDGLGILNSWILDSMGKNATQLLRHCVRLLLLVSTDLLAVRLSGIGKTVKEKVVLHSSRDIRAVAGQLVKMWIEVFRREKAINGGFRLLRQTTGSDQSRSKNKDLIPRKASVKAKCDATDARGNLAVPSSTGSHSPAHGCNKKVESRLVRLEAKASKSEASSTDLNSQDNQVDDAVMSEEEAAAFAAAEAARSAAIAAAQAYKVQCSIPRELPKIPSFHKFARREQYAQRDDLDPNRKWWPGSDLGEQDFSAEIDSRNCRVRNWSVDFSATCNLDNSRISGKNAELGFPSGIHLKFAEDCGENGTVDSSLAKAWVNSNRSAGGGMDRHAIDTWQSQSIGSDIDLCGQNDIVTDEGYSSKVVDVPSRKAHSEVENSSASQAEDNKGLENQQIGAKKIKQGIVDFIASLLMPLYKARRINKEGYKSILKKSVTKIMEQTTESEKMMTVSEFLEYRRKNKIRAFVDKLIEKHMALDPHSRS